MRGTIPSELRDLRGHPVSTASVAAHDAAEQALWRMMSYGDPPLADLDAAIAADPAWALPHAMKAGVLLGLTDPARVAEAAQHLARAREHEAHATPRERAHLAALAHGIDGRWHQACRVWDDLLLEHPRDALALHWAHQWDFYRGDALHLRARPARALPAWDETDPLYPHVLALHAFGLQENHLYPQAEEAARRALALDARTTWAVHAVAHVMEMQGRLEDGAAWLRQHQPAWAEGNGFAVHLWWHLALLRLEALDTAGVLRVVDTHLSRDALRTTLQRVDAAALLWRLHLLGVEVDALFRDLVAGWPLDEAHAGHYAFNDWHAVIALVGAGDLARAERWLAACAARVLAGDEPARANHAMARDVGLPLMRGVLAFARDEHDAAAHAMWPARANAQGLGGSHAQRDLIDLTLLANGAAAAAPAAARTIGRALLHERALAKPPTPLTRHWAQRLGVAERVLARSA
jgi:hypothetical protein